MGAEIIFADEASVRTDYHAGTTWAPIGVTPTVTATGERKSLKMISAVNPRGKFRFGITEGSFDAAQFIAFIKRLSADVGRPIIMIVDNSSLHKARSVKEYIQSTEGRVQAHFLPPYSPDSTPMSGSGRTSRTPASVVASPKESTT